MNSESAADTIIAPATAAGESGVSIVRMSGPRAAMSCCVMVRPSASSMPME